MDSDTVGGRNPQFLEDPIWTVKFVDDQHGWAWGNAGFRTTDGGQTWQQLPFVDSIYDMQFLNTQTGYLVSNLAIYRTNDGGQSVDMVWDWQNFNFVFDASFISETEGLLSAEEDDVVGIFETTDAGESWQRISDSAFSKILHVTADVVVGATGGKFYRSVDGGATWTMVHNDELSGGFNNATEELTLIDADSIAAIDINARIWISDDAGQTWTLATDVFANWGFGWDIQFPTPDVGYVVGRLGLIFKSTDGGYSWQQISNGAAIRFNELVMQTNGIGLAVADLGVVVRTEDFGQHWNVLPQFADGPFAIDLQTVQAIDNDSFVIGGGAFFRSDDGGQTWNQGGDLPAFIEDLSFLNDQEGWACGPYSYDNIDGYYIAHTTDGGQTWTILQAAQHTRVTVKVQVMASGQGWVLSPQSEQAITTDGFVSSYIPREMPSGESWEEFEFGSDNVGWYGGFFGTVLKSSNGGFIFQQQTLPGWVFSGGGQGHRLRHVRALGPTEAYITAFRPGAIYDGVIYRTTDGQTWNPLELIHVATNQTAGAIECTDVLPTGEIWTTGGNGFIFSSGIPSTESTGVPDVLHVIRGIQTAGTVADLASSDDSYLAFQPGFTLNQAEPPVWIELESTTSNMSPNSLTLNVESAANTVNVTQTLEIFDFQNGVYEVVDVRSTSNSDSIATVQLADNVARFVEPGSGLIKLRLGWKPGGPLVLYPWTVRIDHVLWTML